MTNEGGNREFHKKKEDQDIADANNEDNEEAGQDTGKNQQSETSEVDILEDGRSNMDENHNYEAKGSHVSFGSVEVHKHRMTLGSNPSATGIPVELAWGEHSTEILPVDEFTEHHKVHRIARTARRKIAEVNHSRESISVVEKESMEIRQSIDKSKSEDPDAEEAKRSCCTML